MKLKELCGGHILSGVETGTKKRDQVTWVNYIKFCLDDTVYMAVEDPDDGYRSTCEELEVETNGVCNIKIPDTYVTCSMAPDGTNSNDVLVITDVATGKPVLEVGTENYDDYYPCCVMRWMPENLVWNQEKKKDCKHPLPHVGYTPIEAHESTLTAAAKYESPITVAAEQMKVAFEGEVMKAVQSFGVNVDLDELAKALAYDRDQYEQGFLDGLTWMRNRTRKAILEIGQQLLENTANVGADSLLTCGKAVGITSYLDALRKFYEEESV